MIPMALWLSNIMNYEYRNKLVRRTTLPGLSMTKTTPFWSINNYRYDFVLISDGSDRRGLTDKNGKPLKNIEF